MPAKPQWFGELDAILSRLAALPRDTVDSATIEQLLGVSRRRAQQIMAPCITEHLGPNGLADRDRLIEHLRRLGTGEAAYYEHRRRQRVATLIDEMRRSRLERPHVLVEAPTAIVSRGLTELPPGIRLERGRITIEFTAPSEALEKLLALAMAIGNDRDAFENAVNP